MQKQIMIILKLKEALTKNSFNNRNCFRERSKLVTLNVRIRRYVYHLCYGTSTRLPACILLVGLLIFTKVYPDIKKTVDFILHNRQAVLQPFYNLILYALFHKVYLQKNCFIMRSQIKK